MVDYANPVVYRISAADVIEDVNDAWARFAIDNDASPLATEVVGKPLWDYISGGAVKRIYESILKCVRTRNRTVSFPFRCDSPSMCRGMRLFVVPLGQERIEFRAVSETAFLQPKPLDLLNPGRARDTQTHLYMCSWCKAVAIGTEWKPIETAMEELRLFARTALPSIKHVICDSCLAAFLEDFMPEDESLADDMQAYITFSNRWLR